VTLESLVRALAAARRERIAYLSLISLMSFSPIEGSKGSKVCFVEDGDVEYQPGRSAQTTQQPPRRIGCTRTSTSHL